LERPIALFDVNDSIQCFNSHEFNFNDQTTFSALNTLSYFWNYDNGDTSIGKFAKKAQYANFGYKTIELISHSYLTNCYDTFQKLVLVAPHPQSDFEMDFDSLCLNENVFSSNNLSQIPFGTFTSLWNWGDGKTDTFTSGNHSYNNWGQKNIKLIVASNHNCKDSIIKTAMVMPNPKAGFTVNDTAQCMNAQSFDFVSNSIVGIGNVANEWILNNTILMKSLDLSNIDFTTPGYHSVQLNSYSNFGCKDSIVREVFLEKSNQSNAIHLKNDTQCLNGNVFDFNVTSLSPEVSFKSFQWRFGDNQSSNTQLTSHSYLDSGTYEVKVQTVSENNCLDTSALMLRVLPHPMAQFNADSPCFNQSMKFVNLSDTFGNKLSSVVWDLGDGSNSLVYIPEYTYFSQGVFEVTLRLVSEFGCEGELKKEVIVRPKPTAEFSITRLEDKDAEYSTLRMNNLSSTDVSNWRWYFDDKDSSNLENPIAYFKDSNSRPILLVVSNKEGCVDSVMHFTGTLFTEFKLLVPEAFSPDGNNINDVFTVVGSPYVTKFQMEIFNRWGEMVFTTNDISASWDGTYMGEPCEQGLYLCRIYVIPLRGKLQNKNLNILLIR
jgi:gliding motility-associated-like protein